MAAPELESDSYDVIVVGTGVAESIAAAALAKAGKSVLHLDPNEYYGSDQASLTLDELAAWSQRVLSAEDDNAAGPSTTRYTNATTSPLTPQLENDRRRYALSLFPAILPSRGEMIDTLIKSQVSKYVSFRKLDSVALWQQQLSQATPGEGGDQAGPVEASVEERTGRQSGHIRRVPGSKEEVFKDKSVGLVDKRRLMKFLMFAAGDFESDDMLKGKEDQPLLAFLQESFSLSPDLASSIAYAIAHASTPTDPTLPSLLRTRRYLRSVGRYGPGAFLIGQYGGAGEIAQGFCRACAVFGGTYVLGPSAKPTSIKTSSSSGVEVSIPCHSRPVTAKHIISMASHLPKTLRREARTSGIKIARCIAIVDKLPASLRREQGEDGELDQDDTAVVVFPPAEGSKAVVRVLMMGEGTGSCPSGQFVLYLSSETHNDDPEATLRPFLHQISPDPLFESYHITHHATASNDADQEDEARSVVLLEPYAGLELLTEGLDWEAEQGRKAYESVIGLGEGCTPFFERKEGEEVGDVEDEDML